jgi:hypothetical protein
VTVLTTAIGNAKFHAAHVFVDRDPLPANASVDAA